MDPTKKSNLARTAIFMLQSGIEIRMDDFIETQGWTSCRIIPPLFYYEKCGTTCCFAGFGPVALQNLESDEESWFDYIDRTFLGKDVDPTSDIFTFLFSDCWPDDKGEAACRALAFLESDEDWLKWCEYGKVPGQGVFRSTLDTRESIIERLKAFITDV